MSFRGRLTLFFVTIVVIPMVVVGVLAAQVSEDSQRGKADARLAAGLETARAEYDAALAEAPGEIERIANRPRVPSAMRAGNSRLLDRLAERQVERGRVESLEFYDRGGRMIAGTERTAIASSRNPILLPSGSEVGEIEAAMLEPRGFVDLVAGKTLAEAVVLIDGRVVAASAPIGDADLPAGSGAIDTELDGNEARAAGIELGGATPDARLVLIDEGPEEGGIAASQPVIVIVLGAFLALAVAFILALLRMLQGQIGSMLQAARRIGDGDFSHEVPVEGDDELAGLAQEFNRMSQRLSEQVTELQRQRAELDSSVERIGGAFAAGLDRGALLEIIAETAMSATGSDSARVVVRGRDGRQVHAGARGDDTDRALRRAAHEALDSRALGEVSVGEVNAIAWILHRAGDTDAVLGSMAVSRIGAEFGSEEKEVLRYLIGQASVSIENIDLHERAAEQAVTDELTGLSNKRHFSDWMERETERMGRFGGDLSIVLLDLDDFKRVNDELGHLQGDAVLEEIGRVLRLESRGVDEPARYGGEEFVLALPETPKQGALEVAERIRARIETTKVEGVGDNDAMSVTASLGVATMPADAADSEQLISAADKALYRAKDAGKNRVESA